ncbi:DUF983 domain-containing protein [Cohaesibacter gelatinilyticus]|uniref:Uncharacterized conserved protein, DUF983 family n=1 Tax=Cohaesibacter gelatinilyticus TaxID=372072 RepID=A0A285N7M6_9HYPH|nr:DUF983 domain-containing protein [Cohaesibacter gelatinilyticus]SNZ05475.1 Uncharacterized conserved protein, DUF983 family [Cohaesibacter gelatinilyticus]HAT87456.1 DUF983 domain-containing protein [Hyphomicrobiales bacterium]
MTTRKQQSGSLTRSAFLGKCPRCGHGKLYSGFLKIANRCNHCDLDYSFADSGDGPAVFVIMIVGFLATAGVLYTEFAFEPPVWLHVVLWGPLTILLSLLFLYWLKGGLIAQQYKTHAKPGELRHDKPDKDQ